MTHALLNYGLEKVLCRIRKSLIFAKLYEVSIIFRKESFINGKVLNFIQSLIDKKESNKVPNGVPYCPLIPI